MGGGLHGGRIIFLFARSLSLCLLALSAKQENLIGRLPGQPRVGFKQYAGYINIDESAGTNFFYYFVEAAHPNASSLPLTLWLNGGPGCSSIGGGAFTELGPFYPDGTGNGLRLNHHSWNKSNILFLESPAGVGWSYSSKAPARGYNYNDEKVAKENVVFLLKWFERFPEYSQSLLFLTGESYAGHYIPQLASLILRHNRRVAGGRKGLRFNLQGVLVGNPLLNYGLDTRATYSFLWSHGLISDRTYRGVLSSCDFSFGYTGESGSVGQTGKVCPAFLDAAHAEIGDSINMYDVTLDVCPPPSSIKHSASKRCMSLNGFVQQMGHPARKSDVDVCIDHEITRYLNQATVQKSLHANLTSLPYSWEACSRIVNYKSVDQLRDMLPLLSQLLKEGVRIWIFSGDQDSVVPLTGTRLQMTKLAQEMNLKTKIPYRAWYAHGQVGGWFHIYEQDLVYATVRGAAHMVPYAQPERALILFKSFLHDQPLPEHS